MINLKTNLCMLTLMVKQTESIMVNTEEEVEEEETTTEGVDEDVHIGIAETQQGLFVSDVIRWYTLLQHVLIGY